MPKTFIAKSSDFGGPTNPTGIWSPAFLMLKHALDGGDDPDNVRQALYNWLAQRHVSAAQVDVLLDLEPEEALAALVQKIGGGLSHDAKHITLPPAVLDTLRKTLARIAQTYHEKQSAELAQRQQRLDRIKAQFVEGRAPGAVVDTLLR